MFTRADKDNTTVVLNRYNYISKMENMLSDNNTYEEMKTDPTKKLTNDLRSLLSRWRKKEIIDESTYRRLMNNDDTIPRTCGLPKIHKTGHPLRISSINSPLYNLAYYLRLIIKKSIPAALSNIPNSYHLVKQLNDTPLDPSLKLASFDVVSLFTNVPTDLAITCISDKWHLISVHTPPSHTKNI